MMTVDYGDVVSTCVTHCSLNAVNPSVTPSVNPSVNPLVTPSVSAHRGGEVPWVGRVLKEPRMVWNVWLKVPGRAHEWVEPKVTVLVKGKTARDLKMKAIVQHIRGLGDVVRLQRVVWKSASTHVDADTHGDPQAPPTGYIMPVLCALW